MTENLQKGFIKYFVIIIFILAVVFFSQQAKSGGIGSNLISDANSQIKAYVAKGTDWAISNIYSKISGEVQNRGDAIKNEITQEKNKVSENIGEKISDYFSGVENSILNKKTPQDCPPAAPTN
jgi:hypothetical protein